MALTLTDHERDLILLALIKTANGGSETAALLAKLTAPHTSLQLHEDQRRAKADKRRKRVAEEGP